MADAEDSEIVNTFIQLREKVIHSLRAKQRNEEVAQSLEKTVMHKKLVLAEMSKLPADVVTYKNIGKAYLFTPKSTIVSSYENDFKEAETEIKQKRADRETLAKACTSAEDELKEHLKSNPALAQRVAQEAQ